MAEARVSRRDSLRNIAALGAVAAVGAAALGTAPAQAAQPLMHNALGELQAARATLEHALADKGGHRVKAIQLLDAAIAQVKLGIAAGAL